jgi:hypothetical protein
MMRFHAAHYAIANAPYKKPPAAKPKAVFYCLNQNFQD